MDVASDDDDDDDGNEQLIQEITSSLTEQDMDCLKSTLDNDETNNQSNEQRIHTTNHTNSKLKMHPIQNNLDENTATRMESIQHNAVNSNDNTPRNTQPTNTIQHTKHTPHHDDTSEVKANDCAPSSPIKSSNKIKQIDNALATYYASVGVHDYFDSNGIGRFSAFIEREGFDVDPSSIEQELGTQSSADNTTYTEFDAHFPFHDDILRLIEDLDIDKANIIFYILQFCYQRNEAPTNERIFCQYVEQNTSISTPLSTVHDETHCRLTKIQQMDDALAQYYLSVGVNNYFDSNDRGRFAAFIEQNAIPNDIISIEQEIGAHANPHTSWYIAFDPHFPFHDDVWRLMADHDIYKDHFIFYILQFCYAFNTAPAFSHIKREAERISHKDSTVVQDLTQVPAVYSSSVFKDRAIDITSQPMNSVSDNADSHIFAKIKDTHKPCVIDYTQMHDGLRKHHSNIETD
eukprot:967114_1